MNDLILRSILRPVSSGRYYFLLRHLCALSCLVAGFSRHFQSSTQIQTLLIMLCAILEVEKRVLQTSGCHVCKCVGALGLISSHRSTARHPEIFVMAIMLKKHGRHPRKWYISKYRTSSGTVLTPFVWFGNHQLAILGAALIIHVPSHDQGRHTYRLRFVRRR